MSQAALDAYLDYGEGYPDCPACGDNSHVYPAIVTDLDTGEEFRDTLLSCNSAATQRSSSSTTTSASSRRRHRVCAAVPPTRTSSRSRSPRSPTSRRSTAATTVQRSSGWRTATTCRAKCVCAIQGLLPFRHHSPRHRPASSRSPLLATCMRSCSASSRLLLPAGQPPPQPQPQLASSPPLTLAVGSISTCTRSSPLGAVARGLALRHPSHLHEVLPSRCRRARSRPPTPSHLHEVLPSRCRRARSRPPAPSPPARGP
eukprot:COSAG05_NODE_6604_length_931_cov_3.231971_1_plen_257_part_10